MFIKLQLPSGEVAVVCAEKIEMLIREPVGHTVVHMDSGFQLTVLTTPEQILARARGEVT